jgi:hypothetical protein
MAMKYGEDKNAAAIVCTHVHVGRVRILHGLRTEPVNPSDSGWQFLCGATDDNEKPGAVWALHEVIAHEPSLLRFIEDPDGTELRRERPDADWTVSRK